MKLSIAAAILIHLATADWQFKSRPDLAPPRLNITIPAAPNVEQGYLFVAPFAGYPDTATEQHGPRQAAPYIFRDNGDLVWSGYGYYSIWSTNFQAGKWNGKDVLFSFEGDHNPGYGHGHGHTTILDQHYETIRELRAGNHKLTDKHEFHIVGDDTAVIQVYQPVPRDLTPWGASEEQQWIVNAIFQELNITSGELLFEWASLDHISPDEAILPINPGQAGSGYNSSDAWDYFHINSVDKNEAGDYLLSARDACAVHKINGTDGRVIWRLDGKQSSFSLGKGVKFCFQHHARFHPELKAKDDGDDIEIISLYDNSAHGSEDGRDNEVHTAPTSSGKIIKLNTTSWTAELVQGFYPPDDLRSKSQGSTQLLPNGNAIVNWGSSGALTEYDANGTVLFHTYFDSGYLGLGVENYRGFRYNWTGLPNEEPAIVALQNAKGTTIYVSWNGDTETKTWRFYEAGKRNRRHYLGEAKRSSFETSFHVQGKSVAHVVAEAVDTKGRTLKSTRGTSVQNEVLPAHGLSKPEPIVVQEPRNMEL
ncbi:ASST-domain-containing protein [Paraphoma chrysanthemicola]|uniref:ASST-domain-containing protein n=1 Tax=Paraphoma chrysanthemicola TaxID=798071 RepID=A0A8K0QRF3_9PLEO|nr:ASST-domain-containing protein [Paraphoma chrysanthemicola]